jgi:hypothetical protein
MMGDDTVHNEIGSHRRDAEEFLKSAVRVNRDQKHPKWLARSHLAAAAPATDLLFSSSLSSTESDISSMECKMSIKITSS